MSGALQVFPEIELSLNLAGNRRIDRLELLDICLTVRTLAMHSRQLDPFHADIKFADLIASLSGGDIHEHKET
jgi:hypothetical protein